MKPALVFHGIGCCVTHFNVLNFVQILPQRTTDV